MRKFEGHCQTNKDSGEFKTQNLKAFNYNTMEALVEKKLKKLRIVAQKHCKQAVQEELSRVDSKKFKDLAQLTEWFTRVISKQQPRFRQLFQKYEAEQALWVEAYKYIRVYQSPDFIVIHDLLLDIYELVEFYSKDPNKEFVPARTISFKLSMFNASRPEIKALVKQTEQKKEQLALKSGAPKVQAPTPSVATTKPPPPSVAPVVSQTPKPKPPSRVREVEPPQPQPPVQQLKSRPPATVVTPPVQTPTPAASRAQKTREPAVVHAPPASTRIVPEDLVDRPVVTKHIRQMKTHDQQKAISGILMERRDLEFVDVDAKKEVINLIIVQLNTYMKNLLERLIRLAKIHNPSNTRYGDEFKYFGKANQLRLDFELPIDAKVKTAFFKIKFPDKLSIYSALRNNEENEEDKLRVEDTKKRKENEKEIIEYVRGEHRAPKTRVYHDENTMSDKLSIKLSMVQTLMEMDPIYADGQLLRRSYLT